jgi:hypothetical protein
MKCDYVASLLAIQTTRFYITINIQTPFRSMIDIIRCPATTTAELLSARLLSAKDGAEICKHLLI